jgi:hypothetical protein
MKFHRISFCPSDLLKISEAERRFFVTVAHVRNDIRHLSLLIISASKSVKDAGENKKVIALHHYQHLLRLLSGTLFEA